MKRLPLVILVIGVLLVTVVAGCGRAPRYDGRLVAADSLMRSDPDSALTLVEGVCRDSLTAEYDRAYRDLLLTQARYRCYITATSDSDINRALAYYRAHQGEREKLTRAYIYKGAVMEELNHPDSAMLYYKHAESSAAPDDYFNLGYTKMRMGTLYRDYYTMDGLDIQKFEEALKCFMNTSERQYQMMCKINLASLYRLKHQQKAWELLTESMPLALQLKDTINYLVCVNSLTGLCYLHNYFEKGRELVQMHIKNYSQYINREFCYNACKIYSKSGMLDSARFFLNLVDKSGNVNPLDEMCYIECQSELLLAEHDTIGHLRLEKKLAEIGDSLTTNREKKQILVTENEFVKTEKNQTKAKHHQMMLLFASMMMLLFVVAIILFYHYKHRHNQVINDLKEETIKHVNDINTLKQNISQLKIRDNQLNSFINSHIELMKELSEACYHVPNNVLSRKIVQIIQFQNDNNDNWAKLYDYIDNEYNHIITHTRTNYKQLNERDILLIVLSCLGYSCAQIAIITGYSNATSISGNRQRLMKKMGLNCSMYEYINRFRP